MLKLDYFFTNRYLIKVISVFENRTAQKQALENLNQRNLK